MMYWVKSLKRFSVSAHAKSKKHKRTYGLLKKQQEQTVRILTKRQRQLSQSHSENNQEINIESANESINTAAN